MFELFQACVAQLVEAGTMNKEFRVQAHISYIESFLFQTFQPMPTFYLFFVLLLFYLLFTLFPRTLFAEQIPVQTPIDLHNQHIPKQHEFKWHSKIYIERP